MTVVAAADSRGAFDDLSRIYMPVAAVVFCLVVLALLIVGIRDRAGRGRAPSTRNDVSVLEIGYAVGLAVVAGLLLWRSYATLSDENAIATQAAPGGHPALTVKVIASRWNWRFVYPGGVVSTGDGIDRPATLVVPAAQAVHFRLTSGDVAHAMAIPALRTKYDALPGRWNDFGLRFRPGLDYTGSRCSEYCGTFHDQMTFRVDVRPRKAFDAWLASRRAAARR